MITKREANERGHVNWKWLDAYHSFSFGSYFDPKWMGFKSLRVINDDYIEEGFGFETHPHQNMEIITFVIEGALEHKDVLGNHSIIRPGEIQVMSAGSGIEHSEFNPSKDEKTHSLQIWIKPNVLDIKPSYQQYKFKRSVNELELIISPHDKSVANIHQNTEVFVGNYKSYNGELSLGKEYGYWLQCYQGTGYIGSKLIESGDGLAITDESKVLLNAEEGFEFLLFKFDK